MCFMALKKTKTISLSKYQQSLHVGNGEFLMVFPSERNLSFSQFAGLDNFWKTVQKQLPEVLCKKVVLKIFCKIHGKTAVPGSLF